MSNSETPNNGINRELGALWTRQSSTGTKYFTGKIRLSDLKKYDEVKIIVFQNDKKKNEGSPDFRIFLEKTAYEELSGGAAAPAAPKKVIKKPFTASKTPATRVVQESADEELI